MTEATVVKPMAKSKVAGMGPSLSSVSKKGRSRPNRIGLYAVEGWGKCLCMGTKVLMYDGHTKEVQDVKDGDRLMGPDGTSRTVRSTHAGFGPLYRVVQGDGSSYGCNADHLIPIAETDSTGRLTGRTSTVSVAKLCAMNPSQRATVRGLRSEGFERPEAELPIDPYILGVWLGDGTSTRPEVTTPEPEIEAALAGYAAAEGGVYRERRAPGAKTVRVLRSAGQKISPLSKQLLDAGVMPNKHVPHAYKTASRRQRLELLAGLVDTDGHRDGYRYEFTLKDEQLANDVAWIARSVGLRATVVPKEATCTNSPTQARGLYHRVRVSGRVHSVPCRVARKQAPPRTYDYAGLTTKIGVEPMDPGGFYGFELDGDHLFLLGDFTVTHNTSFACYTPNPIVMMTRGEDGLRKLLDNGLVPETAHFDDEATTWNEVLLGFQNLLIEDHQYKVAVLDVLNGAARLCVEHVTKVSFQNSAEKFNEWGRGWKVVPEEWQKLLDLMTRVNEKGVTPLLLAHADIKTVKNPEGPDYDQYTPRIPAQIWEPTQEWLDMILFGQLETFVKGEKDPKKKGKGVGGQDRILRCERTATAVAKNRHNLPEIIHCGTGAQNAWNALAAALVEGKRKAVLEPEGA